MTNLGASDQHVATRPRSLGGDECCLRNTASEPVKKSKILLRGREMLKIKECVHHYIAMCINKWITFSKILTFLDTWNNEKTEQKWTQHFCIRYGNPKTPQSRPLPFRQTSAQCLPYLHWASSLCGCASMLHYYWSTHILIYLSSIPYRKSTHSKRSVIIPP